MTISPTEFWGSNYYEHPPLTQEMLQHAEEALQVRLPEELVSLLQSQNGGYTKTFAHPMSIRTTWAKDHVPFHECFGIVVDKGIKTAQNMLSSAYMAEEWDLPPKQVLLSGDGHWWITLDYRRSDEPSVAWIDVECGEDLQIASSFSEFLKGLVPATTYDQEHNA